MMMTNERKTVTAAYESLDAANTAVFRTLVELAVLLLKNQSGGAGQCPPKS